MNRAANSSIVSLTGFTSIAEYSFKSLATPFASSGLTKENVIDLYTDDMNLGTFVQIPVDNFHTDELFLDQPFVPLLRRSSVDV